MRVTLSDKELIGCRSIGEETEERFFSRHDAVDAAKARLALWNLSGTRATRSKLRACENIALVDGRRAAIQVDEDGWFRERGTESITADVYVVARMINPKTIEFCGWCSADEFHEQAKAFRGQRRYKPTHSIALIIPASRQEVALQEYPTMTLAEFAQRDEALEITSSEFEKLWLISNERALRHVPEREQSSAYTAEEALAVVSRQITLEELRTIHNWKTLFSGRISIEEVA